MTRRNSTSAAGLIMVLLGTTAAQADVTAEQVWDAWNKQYAAYGYQVSTGNVARSGDTLAVTALKLSNSVEGSSMELDIPEMNLREMGDGTVEVTFSDEITAKAQSRVEGEDAPLAMDMTIRKSDAVAIVSGTPDALSYAVTVPEVAVELDQTKVGADNNAPVKMLISVSGIDGRYDVAQTDAGQDLKSNFKASGMKMTASGADPESNGTFTLEANIANMAMNSEATMPAGVDMKEMGAALGKGLAMTGAMRYGATTYSVEATAEQGPTTFSGSAESGSLDFDLSAKGLHYAAMGKLATMQVQTTQVPMPLSANIDATEFDFAFPLAKADVAQPFAGKIGLNGLSVSDDVWSLLDPQKHLPHDPATLIIDLSGTVTPLIDLFSPEAAKATAPPVQIDSLTLNRLQLTLAGADLNGKGAMTFDNSAGMPMPLGAIDLKLAGANKLMDNLVAMGLMPQDQVMFARMMLGLYAVPAGDDLMTSKIEFKEGGQILANGQRIQ